jgi:flagellar biosynthesis protein FlhG
VDVVLVDADLGAPNLHTMMGIERPARSLTDLLGDTSIHLADVLSSTMIERLRLACGAAPILGVANPEFKKKERLIREISKVDADVLVVDLGAGVSLNVIDFFNAADIKVVVVTPQLTSIHNAYGFIKSSLHRLLQRAIAGKLGYDELFARSGWSEEKVEKLLERVVEFDPRYLSVFEPLIDSFTVSIFGNMLESQVEMNVMGAMKRMIRDFLSVDSCVIGALRRSPRIQDSINQRRPFMADNDLDANGHMMDKAARVLLTQDVTRVRDARRQATEAAEFLPSRRTEAAKRSGEPASSERDVVGARHGDEVAMAQTKDTLALLPELAEDAIDPPVQRYLL